MSLLPGYASPRLDGLEMHHGRGMCAKRNFCDKALLMHLDYPGNGSRMVTRTTSLTAAALGDLFPAILR